MLAPQSLIDPLTRRDEKLIEKFCNKHSEELSLKTYHQLKSHWFVQLEKLSFPIDRLNIQFDCLKKTWRVDQKEIEKEGFTRDIISSPLIQSKKYLPNFNFSPKNTEMYGRGDGNQIIISKQHGGNGELVLRENWQNSKRRLSYSKTYGSTRKRVNSNQESSSNDDSKENVNAELTRLLGLPNLGNTCYLNSVIQVLRVTPGFCQFLHMIYDFITRTEVKKAATLNQRHKNLVITLHEIFMDLGHESKGKNIRMLKEKLEAFAANISHIFTIGQQQDSHEFFNWLISELNSCAEHFTSPSKKNRTGFSFMNFQGLMMQNTHCSGCNNKTIKQDLFSDIKIPLCYDKSEEGLEFSDFINKTELLCDENQFYCEQCSKYTDASMQNVITTSPQLLVIHIQAHYTRSFKEDTNLFQVPLTLKYETGASSSSYSSAYKLYSLIIHQGSNISSGHYYSVINTKNLEFKILTRRKNCCPCCNGLNEYKDEIDWIKVDDEKAKAINFVNLSKLLVDKKIIDVPYLAFYVKDK